MRLNNSFGYTIGDVLMRQVASSLEECSGGKALLARLHGDEFAMFVARTSDRADIEVLKAAITRSFSRPFAHDSLEFDLAVSMGISVNVSAVRFAQTQLLTQIKNTLIHIAALRRSSSKSKLPKASSCAMQKRQPPL